MLGGGYKKLSKSLGLKGLKGTSFSIGLILFVMAIYFLRAYIVQLSYNWVWPKIVENTGGDTSSFSPLTFYESLMLVILVSFLFGFS